MKIISKIPIIFLLLCSSTIVYSQCEEYLEKAEILFANKKYGEAKIQYKVYKVCNASANVDEQIAKCDRALRGGNKKQQNESPKYSQVQEHHVAQEEANQTQQNESSNYLQIQEHSVTQAEENQILQTEEPDYSQVQELQMAQQYENEPKQYEELGYSQVKESRIVQGNGEVTVMIAPADLNFPKGENNMVSNGNEYVSEGYIGDYVSAALMPHLLKSGKIQLIDHSLLTPQQNNNGETYSNSAVNYAKEMGARYMVKVTMLKPDVDINKERVRVSPGKVFDGISRLSNAQNRNATNTLKEVLPENMTISNMKVSVKMLVHLVDLQSNRILNTWDAEGKASSKAAIDLKNMPAFGDLFIDGTDFTQTVTGQAIDKAFEKIGKDLNKYLKGNL
jgi:hypothetical protein